MTKRTMPSRPPREHLSPDLIGQYLFGKLPERTRNRVERHLLECDFCSDAVEGYAGQPSPAFAGQHLEDLRRRLDKRVRRFRLVLPFGMQPYAVAASVILLVTCTLAVWMTHFYWTKETRSRQLAQHNRPVAQAPAAAAPAQREEATAAAPLDSAPVAVEDFADAPAKKPGMPDNSSVEAAPELLSANNRTGAGETEALLNPAPVLEKEKYTASVENKSLKTVPQVAGDAEARDERYRLQQTAPPATARGISRVVRGKVTDAATGTPLPGVSIAIKGTEIRALSDARGSFSLEVPAGSPTLVFNLVGMLSEEQDVRTADFLRVQLEPDAESLSDVVVIGYGEADKRAGHTGPVAPVGGMDKFNRYVQENLRRPDTARREAVVRVECVVQADGRLGEFVIRKSAGEGYDREAIRVLKEGPRWHTTRQRGKPAPKKVTLRIPFKP